MEPTTPSVSQLVVIGASAGGIEAVGAVLSRLPADFPAAIVVAQHLDPRRPSHLADILAHQTPLTVRTVTGVEPLTARTVFLAPPDAHVAITDHSIQLDQSTPDRPKPSIDRLLRSAAGIFRDALTAVILSGTDGDGAEGARVVHERGGTVLVQDPLTARFPSMPLAVAPDVVDVVVPLVELAGVIDRLVRGTPVLDTAIAPAEGPETVDPDAALMAFLDQLRRERAIDFTSYRLPTIRRRLQRRLSATGATTLAEYQGYLQDHPEEYQRLLNTFLIKVTSFFRDTEIFSYLREQVLPDLIDTARQHGRELRLWSAGCATGEEAYSLAILIAEALGDELDQFTIRIFATDLDPGAISQARRGVYEASALVDVPPDLLARYFTDHDGQFEVGKRVRSLVIFGEHHLGQRPPFPRIDLVLCRNVLIYFTVELQQRVLQLFAYSLRDGGYLVLGKSETPSPLPGLFEVASLPLRVYRRHGPPVTIPFLRGDSPTSSVAMPTEPRRLPRTNLEAVTNRTEREAMQARMAGIWAEQLLLELPVGVVLVDQRYDIQSINPLARQLLGIHGAALGEDFIHQAHRLPSAELRALIDLAFRGRPPSDLQTGQPGGSDFAVLTAHDGVGDERHLRLSCYPYPREANQAAQSVLITITDVTVMVQQRRTQEEQAEAQIRRLTASLDAAQAEQARLTTQLERTSATNRQLTVANQELVASNAQLRIANEEGLLAREEAQAAQEEAETLNEELQATNEELETLNEELQATVEELNATNDDLRARSLELTQLAASEAGLRHAAEMERSRLAAILASMADAVLVVDRAARRLLTNAAYDQLVATRDGTLQPEDDAGAPLPAESRPEARAAQGDAFRMEFTQAEPDETRRWYEATGQPVRSGDEALGGVVVIRDITDRSLRRLQEEFLAIASHELRTPLTALRGFLQLIARSPLSGPEAAERVRRYATLALEQATRLQRLMEELTDAARLQHGQLPLQLAPIDLHVVASRAVDVAQSLATDQRIELEADRAPVPINGDADRLEAVLLNLLANAIRHAPGTDRVVVRLRRLSQAAELEVEDFGPGIPAAELPHLFTRYYQVTPGQAGRQSGLGLGLYIAQQIVTAHGGRIEVASTEGVGTRFIVTLPLTGTVLPTRGASPSS